MSTAESGFAFDDAWILCGTNSVIEVEPAQVVLIRLPLAAVLADDHARNRFEHLAGTHHRPGIELCCGDGALAGGCGDADERCCRVLDIRDVPERAVPVTMTSALSDNVSAAWAVTTRLPLPPPCDGTRCN